MSKPDWWPETPYPEDVFPMTTDEYIEAIPDPHLRSAVSGSLARWAWGVAESMIWEAMQDHMQDELIELAEWFETKTGHERPGWLR